MVNAVDQFMLKPVILVFVVTALSVVAVSCRSSRPPVLVATSRPIPAAPTVPGEPISIEEVVPGKLRVLVFLHDIRTQGGIVPCWTYVSDGLLAEGQEEIAFTVKRELGEAEDAFPRELLGLYATIRALAAKGQIVNEGGMSQLNRAGPGLLRDDLYGVLYTHTLGQPLDGVKVPGPFLTAIILTGREIDVAVQFGGVRLMSLLGEKYRFFPTAPWLDRRRTEIVRPEAMASSLLARVQRYRLEGACARMEAAPGAPGRIGGKVVLTLTRAAGKRFAEDLKKLGPDFALAVLVNADPEADAIFVWKHGATIPSAITKPGATGQRVAGNFLLIATSGKQDEDGTRLMEDGFGVVLRKDTWDKVRAAIEEGRPIQVPGSGDLLGFALAWAEETFTNPVNGQTYVGRWHRYHPSPTAATEPNTASAGLVKLAGLRLLQPESEIGDRLAAESFVGYVEQVTAVLESTFGSDLGGTSFDVIVQFELSPPHAAHVEVTGRPSADLPPAMQGLADRLQRLPVPEIHGGPVRFLVGYTVRGGTGAEVP